MVRALAEWIGSNDDAPVPSRVRLRIFYQHGGICHISGRRIMPGEPWDLDHVVAICNGGAHRESNLAPALRDKHREKTVADVAEKSRTYGSRARNIGMHQAKRQMIGSKASGWRHRMDGTWERRS